jgi:hypothetical protein
MRQESVPGAGVHQEERSAALIVEWIMSRRHRQEVAMAEFEKRLACVIKSDGKIARGYMIDRCDFDGVNGYVIT